MEKKKQSMTLLVLSDTHGYLNPQINSHLEQADHIIHAGDIGHRNILFALQAYAPVTAVYGNMDGFLIRQQVDEEANLNFLNAEITITHIPRRHFVSNNNKTWQISIFGHTHSPEIVSRDHHLIVNPGSASKPRFSKFPTIAKLTLHADTVPNAELIHLSTS